MYIYMCCFRLLTRPLTGFCSVDSRDFDHSRDSALRDEQADRLPALLQAVAGVADVTLLGERRTRVDVMTQYLAQVQHCIKHSKTLKWQEHDTVTNSPLSSANVLLV